MPEEKEAAQRLELPLGRGCRCSLRSVSLSESHSSEYKAEDKPSGEKPAHHTGACWKLNRCAGLSDPQGPTSSGSPSTLRTLSLKGFTQLAQAKNVLLFSPSKVSNTNKT